MSTPTPLMSTSVAWMFVRGANFSSSSTVASAEKSFDLSCVRMSGTRWRSAQRSRTSSTSRPRETTTAGIRFEKTSARSFSRTSADWSLR